MNVEINIWAVLVAAASNMVIGTLWYGPLFGKPWLKWSGISEMKMTAVNLIILFVGAFLMAYVLDHALIFGNAYMKTGGVSGGLMVAFWNWLGFIAVVTVGTVLWEKKPWALWLLNNGYWLVSLMVMGVILSVWK
jgi:hypothetical protein